MLLFYNYTMYYYYSTPTTPFIYIRPRNKEKRKYVILLKSKNLIFLVFCSYFISTCSSSSC